MSRQQTGPAHLGARYAHVADSFGIAFWDEPEMKVAAFEAGAAEYLVAPVDYEQLIRAISRVRAGEG